MIVQNILYTTRKSRTGWGPRRAGGKRSKKQKIKSADVHLSQVSNDDDDDA